MLTCEYGSKKQCHFQTSWEGSQHVPLIVRAKKKNEEEIKTDFQFDNAIKMKQKVLSKVIAKELDMVLVI